MLTDADLNECSAAEAVTGSLLERLVVQAREANALRAVLRDVIECCDHGDWNDDVRMSYVEAQLDKVDIAEWRKLLPASPEKEA